MSNQFKIREAQSNDISRLKEIIDLSFPRFFRYFALHSVSDLSEPVLVTEIEGLISGFAKLIEFHVGDIKYGCILWIAVHPNFRRKGIADALTEAGVNRLKIEGASAVFASTQRRNKGALSVLLQHGFKRKGSFALRRIFGWRSLQLYSAIWYAPGEVVLMHE